MTEVIETKPAEPVELTGTIEDKRKYGAAVKRLLVAAPLAAKLTLDAADAKRGLFTAMMDVRVTITHEGRPDFGGNSGIWKSQVSDLLTPLFTEAGLKTVDERRTFMNSVSANGMRALIMESYIVKYLEATRTEKPGTPAFAKLVVAEYAAAKRNVPTNSAYFPKDAEKPGPKKGDPQVVAPEAILEAAITQVHTSETQYDLLVVLHAIQRLQTEAAAQMRSMVKGRKNNIPNRPAVRMALSDLTAQGEAMLAIAESKATEETYKTLALVAFTPVLADG